MSSFLGLSYPESRAHASGWGTGNIFGELFQGERWGSETGKERKDNTSRPS